MSTGFIVVMTHAYYSPRYFGPFPTKQAAREWLLVYEERFAGWEGIEHELSRHVEPITGSPGIGPLSGCPLEEVPF